MIEALFISKVRVKLIQHFLIHSRDRFYVRQLTRLLHEQINAIRRELEKLRGIGFLNSEKRGNRVYYMVDPSFLFYSELRSMFVKEFGLGAVLRSHRAKLGKIQFAVLAAPLIDGRIAQSSEVDLLLVGDFNQSGLKKLIADIEKRVGHVVNYSLFTDREFVLRKKRRDTFLTSFLLQDKIMMIGSETDLVNGL